jgi:hypothetical protein
MFNTIVAKALAIISKNDSKGNQPMNVSEKEKTQTEQAATTQALQERLNKPTPLFEVSEVVVVASMNTPVGLDDPIYGTVLAIKDLTETQLGFKYTLELYLDKETANVDFFEWELFKMKDACGKPKIGDLVFCRKGLAGNPKKNFGIVEGISHTQLVKDIYVSSKLDNTTSSCYESSNDLVVLMSPPAGQRVVAPTIGKSAHCVPAPPPTSYSNSSYTGGHSSGYKAPPDSGIPLIDNWKWTDVAYITTPSGIKYSTKLNNAEIKRAVTVLDYEIITVNDGEGNSKEAVCFILADETLAWKTERKSVMCCAYNATDQYLQSKFLAKLDSADKTWYENHSKTVATGLPMAFTITVLSDLVKPYDLGIKKVWIQKNKAAYEETILWEKVLGVNPMAAINRNVSNREFLDSVGPEVAEAMGWTEDSWGIDYVDSLPKGVPMVSMAGVSTATSFAAGGGHASYHGPRNTPTSFQMALCYDRLEKCNYLDTPPTFENEAPGEGNKVLDLEQTLDKNGKKIKESVFNNTAAGKTEPGWWWTLDYQSKTPTSNPKTLAPPRKGGKGHQSGKNLPNTNNKDSKSFIQNSGAGKGKKKSNESDVKLIPGARNFTEFASIFSIENMRTLTQTPFEYYSSQGTNAKSVTFKRKDLISLPTSYHKAFTSFVQSLAFDVEVSNGLEETDLTTKIKVVDKLVQTVKRASTVFNLEAGVAMVCHAFNLDPEDIRMGHANLSLILPELDLVGLDIEAWVLGMTKTLADASLLDIFVTMQELAKSNHSSEFLLFVYAVHNAYAVA